MSIPRTVTTALADRPVEDMICLEAGAGVGKMTRSLLAAGARHVYAITDDPEHAQYVRDRLDPAERERTTVIRADLRAIPLPDNTVELVTAHGVFNVLAPDEIERVASELTRVAMPESHLVIDDYEPPPDEAAVRDLFALENAAMELAHGRPALTFYPAALLRSLFVGYGWTFDRERTLLDPVPWTENHLESHAAVVRTAAARLDDELATPLIAAADRLVVEIGSESTGEMYSLALRLPT